MVSVGTLAVVINLCLILTVSTVDRAIERIVCRFAASRLYHTSRAPIIHDSDTWLPNIPRSFVKFYRYPAILMTMCCGIFLVVSELLSEFGVSVCETCKPKLVTGKVIRLNATPEKQNLLLSASAFFVYSIPFLDKNLTSVNAGMPILLTPKLVLSKIKPPKHPYVTHGCNSTPFKTYNSGELSIGVCYGGCTLGIHTVGFRKGNTTMLGQGDVTFDRVHRGAYLLRLNKTEPVTSVSLFSYNHQSHCKGLTLRARKQASEMDEMATHKAVIWERTRAPVRVSMIRCEVNKMAPVHFLNALHAFRTMQMMNVMRPLEFTRMGKENEEGMYRQLTNDDINRAVLGAMITDEKTDSGSYPEYTQCGTYNAKFLIPLALCLVFLLSLYIYSLTQVSEEFVLGVPNSSESWYASVMHWRDTNTKKDSQCSAGGMRPARASQWNPFVVENDEMVLVQNEEGQFIDFEASPVRGGRDGRVWGRTFNLNMDARRGYGSGGEDGGDGGNDDGDDGVDDKEGIRKTQQQ